MTIKNFCHVQNVRIFFHLFNWFYSFFLNRLSLILFILSKQIGHAYIFMLLCFIGCIFGWSFALLYDHCSHFHMTVLCLIKFLTCFTSCLLDHNLLVTLYLFFYNSLYLEGLMCFVQVFQVTGIYVPSASQLLDLCVSEFCHCSQTHA